MFKHKSLNTLVALWVFKSLIIFGILGSCGSCVKTTNTKENVKADAPKYNTVISKTDSVIELAEIEIDNIKHTRVLQTLFVDSLQHIIIKEKDIQYNINKELEEKINVESDLELTKEQLERALISCKNKENELAELNEKFALKSEQFMDEIEYYTDREVKLVIFYNHKIDSLKNSILNNTIQKDTVKVNKNKWRKRKQ